MDTSNTAMMNLLSNLQQKYTQLNLIYEATRKIGAMSGEISEEMLAGELNKRQLAMNKIDQIDQQNKNIISRLPESLRQKMNECLSPSGRVISLDNPLQTNIFETNKKNFALLKRILEEDKKMRKVFDQIKGTNR